MASIPNERGFSNTAPRIYTSNQSSGLLVYTTSVVAAASPAGGDTQQAYPRATGSRESLATAGITVPVVQVISEYIESGIFGTQNSGNPSAGQVEGANTTVYKASQAASTGNEQNPGSGQTNPFSVNPPWSVDSAV